MRFFNKKSVVTAEADEKVVSPAGTTPAMTPANGSTTSLGHAHEDTQIPSGTGVMPKAKVPLLAIVLGAVASIGGFVFGYESGQISGMSLADLPPCSILSYKFSLANNLMQVSLQCLISWNVSERMAPLAP